jgi:hypothetical protein
VRKGATGRKKKTAKALLQRKPDFTESNYQGKSLLLTRDQKQENSNPLIGPGRICITICFIGHYKIVLFTNTLIQENYYLYSFLEKQKSSKARFLEIKSRCNGIKNQNAFFING